MRKHLLACTLALLTCGLAATAWAEGDGEDDKADEKTYELNIGTVAPAGTPWSKQLEQMEEQIEEQSDGRIKVKLFMGTAGGEKSIVRQAKSGQLQAAAVSVGALATTVPEMNVFELPFLFEDRDEADRIIDNHLFEPVGDLLEAYGFELYLFSENGYRNFAAKGKCIEKPEDLSDLKMRVQESWVHEEMYRALGGNPSRIGVPETLTALQTGNVDGFDNTPLFAFAAGWYQAVDHWTVSDHIYQPALVVYNKDWFDELPEDLQKVVKANKEEITEKGRRWIRALRPKLLKNLEAADVKVCKLSAEQRKAFAEKSKEVHEMFRKRAGKKGAELLDIIQKHK